MFFVQANAPTVGAAPRTFERVAVVRTLANRKVPSAIVHGFAPTGAEIVVVERHGGLDPAALDAIETSARTTMTLRHPNVACVRDVWRENGEVAVASEFVEGETLEEVRRLGMGGKELTLEVGVRVVVDVLAALSALHTLPSLSPQAGAPAGSLAHGEITSQNVIVGFDGLTRVVRPYRGHVAGKLAEPDWFSFAAPEVIRGGPASVHGDLYAVGVILWETLSRRKLFPKATREGRAARSLPVGKPAAPPDAAWAAPLAAVAERALANDPAARYTSAAEMAAAVRLAVRSKLAMPPRVAAAVDKLAGERILARRNTNALPEALTPSIRPSGRPSRPSVPPEAMRALTAMRPSSRPPPPKLDPTPTPAMPKAPPVPSLAIQTAPTPPPPMVFTRPRPPVPPIQIAAPTPKPPIVSLSEDAPISIDEASVMPASSSHVNVAPIAPPVPLASTATDIAAIVPAAAPSNKRLLPIVAALVILFAIAIAIAFAIHSFGSASTASTIASTKPAPTASTAAFPTTTTTTSPTPSSAQTTATPTATATTSSSTDAPENSAAPDTSATSTPDATHRPHTRPRPTYDPMGI